MAFGTFAMLCRRFGLGRRGPILAILQGSVCVPVMLGLGLRLLDEVVTIDVALEDDVGVVGTPCR